MLLACTLAALGWANSPGAAAYTGLWRLPVSLGAGPATLTMDLRHWIDDGLMAVFFLVVGLEIKRELLAGELASRRQAALPVAAALGGMLVPALLYTAVNHGGPGAHGWGIPMATDIAFALGALALLGRRMPLGLKVFLTALAIVDDLGAVLVIALFYAGRLNWLGLAVAGGVSLMLLVANRLGVHRLWVYALLGLPLWVAVLESGVHSTIAGVLLALAIPMQEAGDERDQGPLHRLEGALNPWVAFGIMPLFALANAGVALDGNALGSLLRPVGLGVLVGLVVGKPTGILLFGWLAIRLGVAELPAGATWAQMGAIGMLGGIGFTMSLFVTGLAFADAGLVESAKLGILLASTTAGVGGWLVARAARS